jgi:DNA-binding transcriptional ArsR family regulator
MGSDDVLEAVSHPLRVEIIRLLAKGPRRFADIKRELRVESSGLLDFHLKKLGNLISINEVGFYVLNDKGFAALQAVEAIQIRLAEKSFLHKSPVFHHNEHLRHANNGGISSIHASYFSSMDDVL